MQSHNSDKALALALPLLGVNVSGGRVKSVVTFGQVKRVLPRKPCTNAQAVVPFTSGKMTGLICDAAHQKDWKLRVIGAGEAKEDNRRYIVFIVLIIANLNDEVDATY
ncbi:hypothetical protein Tco_1035947 [Tanacetum coccineum]